jgi:hypothetical protein
MSNAEVPKILTHWKALDEQRFLGVYALPNGEDMTVTISHVQKETITTTGGKKDVTIAYLVETKPMILNKTNRKAIEKLYKTPYIELWAGKRITLHASTTKMGGEMTECLRIRPKIPTDAKETLGDARMDKALEAVQKGTFAAAALRAKYALTEDQEQRLAAVEAQLAGDQEGA